MGTINPHLQHFKKQVSSHRRCPQPENPPRKILGRPATPVTNYSKQIPITIRIITTTITMILTTKWYLLLITTVMATTTIYYVVIHYQINVRCLVMHQYGPS